MTLFVKWDSFFTLRCEFRLAPDGIAPQPNIFKGKMSRVVKSNGDSEYVSPIVFKNDLESEGAMAKRLPDDIRRKAEETIEKFNREEIQDPGFFYVPRFRGMFIYLDRESYAGLSQVCRVEYYEETGNWGFAIYKYSDNRYDTEEWFFPGSEHIDGSIEGAMRAGLEAYP